MPTIITRGEASAKGFGFAGASKEPPGTYTYPNGYSGAAYQPRGYTTVSVTCFGSAGQFYNAGSWGGGSQVTKNSVPVASLLIYCPSGQRSSQSGFGNGGIGATSYMQGQSGNGGGVCAAVWSGGTLVAAGAGGTTTSGGSRGTRKGAWEGYDNGGSHGTTPSNSNGTNGVNSSPCYYAGGGGGGGYTQGGAGGQTNCGGMAGGNGASPSPSGTGSYGYDTIVVNSVFQNGYATSSWS